jgi:monoamine oxidase
MFFTGGSTAKELSHLSNAEIVNQLITEIKKYIDPAYTNFTAKNFTVSRWEQDPFAKGSYSYHAVETKESHFRTLSTPIDNKLYFIGEHTIEKVSSNVHGAFKAGFVGADRVAASLFGFQLNLNLILALAILILAVKL